MKKAIKTQEYIFKHETYADGSSTLHRHNDGFNVFELLGILSEAQRDIVEQIKETSPGPTHIKKTAVEPEL